MLMMNASRVNVQAASQFSRAGFPDPQAAVDARADQRVLFFQEAERCDATRVTLQAANR